MFPAQLVFIYFDRVETSKNTNDDLKDELNLRCKAFIVVMFFLNHIQIGLAAAFGNFLTTFAVKSNLDLTKVQGAHVTAINLGSFALTR